MSHNKVLLAHKDKDYRSILERNYTDDDPDWTGEPFGYDYFVAVSETMKVKDALQSEEFRAEWSFGDDDWFFSEVIQEDEYLYTCEGYGEPAERSANEAMAMLNPEYYCTVFDGHL